jgi:hypothetical protein
MSALSPPDRGSFATIVHNIFETRGGGRHEVPATDAIANISKRVFVSARNDRESAEFTYAKSAFRTFDPYTERVDSVATVY